MFGVYFETCGGYLRDELYRAFDDVNEAIDYAQDIVNNDHTLTCEETYIVINEETREGVYTAG